MLDEDYFDTVDDDDTDDFDYYVSYIKALEEDMVSRGDIVRELMDEFDLDKEAAVKILKKYLREKSEGSLEDDSGDEEDDIVEDNDYSDGNSER